MMLRGIPRASRFPRMLRVKQEFAGPTLSDVAGATRAALAALALPVRAGQTVALTVGSRGVVDIVPVVRAAVDHLRELGARPFIIPAMGSHGGGTAEGQRSVLEHYGVTETAMGCPIRASMDVVQLGTVPELGGLPVWCDRAASEADWVGAINRVKPHTGFTGEIGSGLLKMMTIGMGKHRGAVQAHRANIRWGYERMITAMGRQMLETGRIAFGLGIVENGYDQTALVRAFLPSDLEAGERELLRLAKAWMAKLPFETIDLLVVDEIGKDVSGTGMDTHVIGRHATFFERPFRSPRITFIVACDLTARSGGNANGIGLADFTTRRLADRMDPEPTYVNALTACSPGGPKLPVVLDTARDAVAVALECLGLPLGEEARVVRIKNTLHLGEVEISEAFRSELAGRPDHHPLGEAAPLAFAADGSLLAF
jgi:hypothetical protein